MITKPIYKKIDDIISKARELDEIPIPPGNSHWLNKLVPFLEKFEETEVKELKCSNKDEMKYLVTKFKYSALRIRPKQFIIKSREIDKEFYIWIKRIVNI